MIRPRTAVAARTSLTRKVVTVVSLLAATLLLTSCVQVKGNLNVHKDNSYEGIVTLEVTKQAAALLGITSAEDLKQKIAAQGGPDASLVKVEETDTTYRMTAPESSKTSGDKNWKVTSSGSTQTIQIENTSSTQGGTIDVTFHVDGKITGTSGSHITKLGDDSFKVKGGLDSPWSESVTVDTSASTVGGGQIALLGGGVLVILLVAGLVVVLSRRRKPALAQGYGGQYPQGYAQPGYPQPGYPQPGQPGQYPQQPPYPQAPYGQGQPQQYPQQPPYPQDPYGQGQPQQPPYPGQQYPGQQPPGQPYPGQPYPGQQGREDFPTQAAPPQYPHPPHQ